MTVTSLPETTPHPELSLIIPAYNEAGRFGPHIPGILDYLRTHYPAFELLVVDDGSADQTAAVVQAAFAAEPRARLISYQLGPQAVSRVIQQAIETPRPKARYLAGISFSGRLVIGLRDFLWDPVVRQMFKIAPAKILIVEKT